MMRLPDQPRALAVWLAIAAGVDLLLTILVALLTAGNGWAMLAVGFLGGGTVAFSLGTWSLLRRALAEDDFVTYKLQTQLDHDAMEQQQSTAFRVLMRQAAGASTTDNAQVQISAGPTCTTVTILPSWSTSRI